MSNIDPAAISPEDIDDLNGSGVAPRDPSTYRRPGVRDSVREDLRHGREWARERAGRTEAHIREHPLESTLWALGAGVILGILISR